MQTDRESIFDLKEDTPVRCLLLESQLSVTRFVLICYICRVQQNLYPLLIYYMLSACCSETFQTHKLQASSSFSEGLVTRGATSSVLLPSIGLLELVAPCDGTPELLTSSIGLQELLAPSGGMPDVLTP
jgi:hypothetical protein